MTAPQISRRTALAGALAASIAKPTLAQPTLPSGAESRIDAVAHELITGRKTPGLVVAVACGGRMALVKGYGMANLEHAIQVRPDTVFRIASITKQFAAAAILWLAERGALKLDVSVSKYLPEMPDAERFTIRQMLNNTSGLANFQQAPLFDAYTRISRSRLDMLAYISGQKPRLAFEPGTQWQYSSSGFYLAGVIVERLSETSLAEFFEQHFFKPLGMTATALDSDEAIVPGRAAGYDAAPDRPGGFANASQVSLTVPFAAGGLRSVPADLIRWHSALFGGKVLKPASVAEMRTPARLKDGSLAVAQLKLADEPLPPARYGLGLILREIDGRAGIGHAGGINGFSCYHETYPDLDTQLLVLANSNLVGILAQVPLSRALFAGGA